MKICTLENNFVLIHKLNTKIIPEVKRIKNTISYRLEVVTKYKKKRLKLFFCAKSKKYKR